MNSTTLGTRSSIPNTDFAIPLYIQIADELISRIESGSLSPGDQLAPERELSSELNVNRMTLRKALQLLESQGLLERRHGVGNFIAHSRIDRRMETIFRFSKGVVNRGFTPGTRLINIRLVACGPNLAMDFNIDESDQVYDILRLRLINQEPVMLEGYKIPVQRFPGLHKFDLEGRSIYEILETDFGTQIVRNRQSLEPIIATKPDAKLLEIKPGDPLMLEKRISYDQQDQPIEFGKDRYRGDRFRFIAETYPGAY